MRKQIRELFLAGQAALLLWVSVAQAGCGVRDEALELVVYEEQEKSTESFTLPEQMQTEAEAALSQSRENVLYVHVCGAVQKPGVVELPTGSRAAAAVEAAGGFTREADESYLNLAQKLEDGQRLYIPTKEEAQELIHQESAAADGRININTATAEALTSLPGIGQARAADIVAYREQHGGFSTKEELMQVSGIKESTYNKLCDRIVAE